MPEKSKPMVAHQVDYVCDACKEGRMRSTGMVLTSMPAKYPHRCDTCDSPGTFLKQYPCIEWREQ